MPQIFVDGRQVQECTTVDVRVGEIVAILAREQATAGYTWQLRASEQLKLIAQEAYPLNPGVAGSPDVRIFVLMPQKPGPYTLTLTYGRPWESESVQVINLSITVPESSPNSSSSPR
ncbi:MAG: protease inhibitor I42 family protein [Mycobacterium leprae]